MMIPLHVVMVPMFVIFKELDWLNTYKPLIVPAFLGGGAFNIFLLASSSSVSPKNYLMPPASTDVPNCEFIGTSPCRWHARRWLPSHC